MPKELPFILVPIINRIIGVKTPNNAFGKRAAKALIPKTFMLSTCSQKKRGGFS